MDPAGGSLEVWQSDSKLPQMMVEMSVHQARPPLGRHLAEETMRILRAPRRTSGSKLVNQSRQPLAFLREVSFVRHNQALRRGRILPERVFIAKHQWLHQPPHQSYED